MGCGLVWLRFADAGVDETLANDWGNSKSNPRFHIMQGSSRKPELRMLQATKPTPSKVTMLESA
jgi:hypothetical protein